MAGRLLFVFFMYVFNGIQTEARLPPKLTVNSAVITETDSVTLNCQTPSSVSVSQCYYQTLSGGTVKILSCQQTLTGSELLKMDHQSSPAEVKVKCFYTVQNGGRNAPHSDTVSISIQTLPQPDLMVNPAVITETDSVTLNCQTPSSVSVSQCYYQTLSGGTVKILSCLQTLTGSELLKMDHQSSPAEVKVKCFYTVQNGDINLQSPESEYSSVSVQSETNSNKESASTLTTSVSIVTSPADQGWTVGTSVNGGSTVTSQTPGTPESGPTVSLPDTKELWNWTFVWVFAGCGSTVIITVIVNVILWKKRRAGIVEKESRRNQRMPSLIKTTGSEGMERSESRKSNRSLYHIYSTIYEGQTAAASKDMIYSKLQAH
ncbi:uncharacterized protein LOC132978670 isoform X2 [Labrus mixtus]|uniref:uncharacterized protein LOC132978670 isoform X2 n=1 Tax=Labrus mixtus TaxID=508554 RepID=UPI0029C08259|nr:uncharacterized protein LOC132978670 isoform X2 [Labrus mixtus]